MRRIEKRRLETLPEWVRIGAEWGIGIGEPIILDPGDHVIHFEEDALVRILFGTLFLCESDGVHGLDAGWIVVGASGEHATVQVKTRTQLRRFLRREIEAARRLYLAYHTCLGEDATSPSGLRGNFVSSPDLRVPADWIPSNTAVLLRDNEGPLSQVLASLPSETLLTVALQRPYEGGYCPSSMYFYNERDVHPMVLEALARARISIRREELFVRHEDEVMRWMPTESPFASHLLEALPKVAPKTETAAREVLNAAVSLTPVIQAIETRFPQLKRTSFWAIALASPLSIEAAQRWNIGTISLRAVRRTRPFGDSDFEVVPGAVDGTFRTAAVIVGPLSSEEHLVIDVESAADHEIEIHRFVLDRRDDAIVVTDTRCLAQAD